MSQLLPDVGMPCLRPSYARSVGSRVASQRQGLSAPRRRCGLTLVELLIVIAVIAILVGVMFPVLQVVRESARRSSCGNNLRQLALAMMTYSDSHKSLPGWRNTIDPFSTSRAQSDPKKGTVSWSIPILPNIEEIGLYDWYTSAGSGQSSEESPPSARIKSYCCPSHTGTASPTALSYAVNAGTGAEILDERATPASLFPGDGMFLDTIGNETGTALFDQSRPAYTAGRAATKEWVTDGAVYTILLTERSGPSVPPTVSWAANPRVPRENRGAIVENHSVLHPLPIGSGWRTEVQVINPTAETRPQPSPVPGNADLDDWPLRYPSSRHPTAVNVAFADGHVRVIRNGIDAWVYCQLLTSNSKMVSSGVADWQRHFDASGNLVPYTLNTADLIR